MGKKSNEVTNGFSRSKFDLRKESEGSPASYHGLRWDFYFAPHSMPILLLFRQFNHLLAKEGKGGRTSNSSRRLPSTLVEEIIPEDSQVPQT